MKLGDELRKARLAKKLTTSQIAAATRMKVQVVEALEREDFSSIAAPIYSKGFIKLYAEYVGLDPKPLIEDFTERFLSPPPEQQSEKVIEEHYHTPIATEKPLSTEIGHEPVVAEEDKGKEIVETAGKEEMDLFAHAAKQKEVVSQPEKSLKDDVFAVETQWEKKEISAEREKETFAFSEPKEERNRKSVSETVKKVRDIFVNTGANMRSLFKTKFGKRIEAEKDFERLQDIRRGKPSISFSTWMSIIGGIIIILVFVFSIVSRYVHKPDIDKQEELSGAIDTIKPLVNPPPPYID